MQLELILLVQWEQVSKVKSNLMQASLMQLVNHKISSLIKSSPYLQMMSNSANTRDCK